MSKVRNFFDRVRYLRSFKLLIFSFFSSVFLIVLLYENMTRGSDVDCLSGEVTNISKSNYMNRSGGVRKYDLKISLEGRQFVQSFVKKKEFENILKKVKMSESLEICYIKNQVISIKSQNKEIFNANFNNLFLIFLLVLSILFFILTVYYLLNYKSDLAR
jgi:hypothetical protein